ncbi:MAG: Secretion system C-terminal sorting domain, partial [Bacteroidota bacterium]
GKWHIDSTNGQLVIEGKGLYLGLPKATNNGELVSGSVVPDDRSYQIGLTANRLTAVMNYGGGFWQFQFVRSIQAGTTTNTLSSDWRIYPNPSENLIHIICNERPIAVRLLTETGQCISTTTATDIDISQLRSGLYFVEIQTANQSKVMRILKQ